MHDYHTIFPPSSSWWRSTSILSVLKGAPPLLIVSRGVPPAAAPKPRPGINSCNDTAVPLPRTRVTASFTSPLLLCYLGRVLLPLSHLHCCFDGQILIGWLLCGLGPCWHLPAHSSDHSQSEKPFHGYFHVTLPAFITVWSNSLVESNVISQSQAIWLLWRYSYIWRADFDWHSNHTRFLFLQEHERLSL